MQLMGSKVLIFILTIFIIHTSVNASMSENELGEQKAYLMTSVLSIS